MCDRRISFRVKGKRSISFKVKGKVYKTVVGPAMMYGAGVTV